MKIRATTTMLVVLALAGCGSSKGGSTHASRTTPAVSPAQAAESAFASHAGLAFGTFNRYIYTPYRSGQFTAVAANKAALTRAALAARYVATQLEQATAAAQSSAALAKLVPPLRVLGAGFRAALVKLRTGGFKMSEIQAASIAISAIKGSAMNAGLQINEATPSAI